MTAEELVKMYTALQRRMRFLAAHGLKPDTQKLASLKRIGARLSIAVKHNRNMDLTEEIELTQRWYFLVDTLDSQQEG